LKSVIPYNGVDTESISIKDSLRSMLKQLKEETWYNLQHPDMDSEFRLEIALQLLTIVDWVHMGIGPDQCTLYKQAEKNNIHITRPHKYSPLPFLSQLPNQIWNKEWNQGIDWNEKNGLELLERLIKYSVEYKDLTDSNQFDIVDQNEFKHLDSALYYALIRHFKPKTIIEVGAGNSTQIASLACMKNASGEILAIERDPKDFLKNGSLVAVSLIQKSVQEVPVDVFKQLEENDILFIDSSHVCKIGSDVNYLFLEVLPQLKKGVLIHIHDIFLPLSYPRSWVEELDLFWNEQYMLHAFLIGNRDFEVLISNNYMVTKHPKKIARLFDQDNKYNGLAGGSFWMKKIKK
jgi:predicted O-methyltransferase YrrM